MWLRIPSIVVLATLLSALAGCTSATGAGQRQPGDADARPSKNFAAGAESLPDKVTKKEYEAAVRRLAACLKKSGVKLINDGWDPVDHERMILRYVAPGMPFERASEIYERCQAKNLAPVEAKYNDDNKSYMAPELMTAVQACLTAERVNVTGREKNPEDLLQTVPESRHQDLRDCVRESVREIYPNLFTTSFP